MSWRGLWLSLVLLCTGAALAQLPPRGITPTPRHTPSPTSTPAPQPTIPVVTPSPVPSHSIGIYTYWELTVRYRETPDGPLKTHSVQYEEGADKKTVTVTLWRYKQ